MLRAFHPSEQDLFVDLNRTVSVEEARRNVEREMEAMAAPAVRPPEVRAAEFKAMMGRVANARIDCEESVRRERKAMLRAFAENSRNSFLDRLLRADLRLTSAAPEQRRTVGPDSDATPNSGAGAGSGAGGGVE